MNTFYKNVGLWMRMVRDSQSKKHTQTKFYDVCKLYNISDNMIGDLLRQFKETPNAETDLAVPQKILQVIDGGKHE